MRSTASLYCTTVWRVETGEWRLDSVSDQFSILDQPHPPSRPLTTCRQPSPHHSHSPQSHFSDTISHPERRLRHHIRHGTDPRTSLVWIEIFYNSDLLSKSVYLHYKASCLLALESDRRPPRGCGDERELRH